jgi:hypothetical protein
MAFKFGTSQFNNPTPARLGNAIQVFTVVAAIVLAWIGTATFIPTKQAGITQSILGLLIGIANGVKPFFGVVTKQTEVPIANVTAMEEPTP